MQVMDNLKKDYKCIKKNKEMGMGELGGRYTEFVSLYSRSEYAFSTPDEIIFLGCISRKIT